jgi:exodeoxyribonuclease VII small subunit
MRRLWRLWLDGGGAFAYFVLMSKVKDNPAAEPENPPFEEALKRLESIVESMEAQDLPLETLLARYEEGAKLTRLCQAKLNEAELKVQQLEKNARGEVTAKAINPAQGPQ